MNRILVIGGTGTVGRQVVSQLVAKGVQVRALVRNSSATPLPPQVEVVRGDLTLPETLDPCLDGIDTVFLVWTAPAAAVAPPLERIAKHARRIVLLSAPIKTAHPLFQQANPLRALFEQIEQQIEASGLQWTFLRPGMFAANALSWWAPQIRLGNVVRWPHLGAPTAPIDERDIAAVAVHALCEDGHAQAEYVLTGPQSLSQFEQLSILSSVIGRSLRIEEISPDQARRELLRIGPLPAVNMLLQAWAAAIGQPAHVTSTVAEINGVPPKSFLEWATDNAAEFQAGDHVLLGMSELRDLLIRRAAISEQKELEDLQLRASLTNPGDRDALLAHPDAIELPVAQIAAGGVFVAEWTGTIVGFAAVEPRADGESELDALFVEPNMRRRGIARALVAHCAQIARTGGSAFLHVVGNPHAREFYAACGFNVIGTSETRFGTGLLMRMIV